MKINKYKKGFTLLEILLVIAAIGILAAIVLIAINPNKQIAQARNTVRQADINTIQKALDQYLIETRAYPTSVSTTPRYICNTDSLQSGGPSCAGFVDLKVLVPNYIAAIPKDPQATGDSTGYIVAIAPNNKISITASLAERKPIVNNTFTVTSGLVLNLDAGNTASYPGTGTTWTDLSGNGNNGTLFSGVGYNSANGGSLVFDGVNDYVNLPNSLNLSTNSGFTICLFLQQNTTHTNTTWNYFYSKSSPEIEIGTYGTQSKVFVFKDNSVNSSISSGDIASSWSYMCFGTNPTTRTPFTHTFNSTGYYSATNPNAFTNQTLGFERLFTTGVSGGPQGIQYYGAKCSVIQVYNQALTPEEVQQNFNALRGRYGL